MKDKAQNITYELVSKKILVGGSSNYDFTKIMNARNYNFENSATIITISDLYQKLREEFDNYTSANNIICTPYFSINNDEISILGCRHLTVIEMNFKLSENIDKYKLSNVFKDAPMYIRQPISAYPPVYYVKLDESYAMLYENEYVAKIFIDKKDNVSRLTRNFEGGSYYIGLTTYKRFEKAFEHILCIEDESMLILSDKTYKDLQ